MLEWLEIFPKSENITEILNKPIPNPVLNINMTITDIDSHIPTWKSFESCLGYNFKNRAFLLQALTHSSYTPNRITNCYQRLEFLGDAVLDFLITCYIYETCGNLTPGDLTDLRSALVNNVTFACFTVKYGFYKHMLSINQKLDKSIEKFVLYQESKNYVVNDDVVLLLQETDNELYIGENVDVPKVVTCVLIFFLYYFQFLSQALGDLFEALAGAVYLDSGMNLETVWKVFYKLMWKEIDEFSKNIPKNAVRLLHETVGAHPLFQ